MRFLFRVFFYLFFFLLFIQTKTLYAQGRIVFVQVNIFNQEGLRVDGVGLTVTDLATNFKEDYYSRKGLATFNIPLDRVYRIELRHPGYYAKIIEYNSCVTKKAYSVQFKSKIDVYLFLNCENDISKQYLMTEPIGRVIYNKQQNKFDYDEPYTTNQGAKYRQLYEARCIKPVADSSLISKIKEIDTATILIHEEIKGDSIVMDDAQLTRSSEDIQTIKMDDEAVAPVDTGDTTGKFDGTKPQIFLYPKSDWQTLLQKAILEPGHEKTIFGQYAYTENDPRLDFYYESIEELITKFPSQFAQAFPEWDYYKKLYLDYKNKK